MQASAQSPAPYHLQERKGNDYGADDGVTTGGLAGVAAAMAGAVGKGTPAAFKGKDAVAWLQQQRHCDSEAAAARLLTAMLQEGVINDKKRRTEYTKSMKRATFT